MTGYLSPKLEARPVPQKGGFGVFAREEVQQGELLIVWSGNVVTLDQLRELPLHIQHLSVQVEEELYLAPAEANAFDYVNHSCTPNAGIVGQITVVALRDIVPDEEICYDYAMTDGSSYDEFECECGTPACRKRITGNDWMMPELQERYAGYFSPYIQRRIERLKASVRQESVL